jgi:hypothetical protein
MVVPPFIVKVIYSFLSRPFSKPVSLTAFLKKVREVLDKSE